MQEIPPGLYPYEGEMPCTPRSINIYHYLIPSTLGKAEKEEAAARINFFSQQLDHWVGVSWGRLAEMMQEDLDLRQQVQAVNHHNFEEYQRIRKEKVKYYAFSALTFGLYAIFVKRPVPQLQDSPGQLPLTTLFLTGSQPVIAAIHQLIDEGLLSLKTQGSEEDPIDIFFPTPQLIERIMARQGLTPA